MDNEETQRFNNFANNIFENIMSLSNFNGTSIQQITEIVDSIIRTTAIENINNQILNSALQESEQDLELKKKENIELKILSYNFSGKEITCRICLNNIIENDIVSKLECLHVFHTKCIKNWGKYKPECPLCRSKLSFYEKNSLPISPPREIFQNFDLGWTFDESATMRSSGASLENLLVPDVTFPRNEQIHEYFQNLSYIDSSDDEWVEELSEESGEEKKQNNRTYYSPASDDEESD